MSAICHDVRGTCSSSGTLLVDPSVGMLFIDFERGHRMRSNGIASIDPSDRPRYIHRHTNDPARDPEREVI